MSTETSVSRSAVYRARPTLRLAGEADERASELLVEMCIAESEGGMSTAELRFSNWASTIDGRAEAAFEDGSRLTLGTAISVHAGDETQPRELFRGEELNVFPLLEKSLQAETLLELGKNWMRRQAA